MSSVEKKKRGRKPKEKKIEEVKIPKKRGRKPKIKTELQNEKQSNSTVENIILSLPIKQDILSSLIKNDEEPQAFNYIKDDLSQIKLDDTKMKNVKIYPIKSSNIINEIKEDRVKDIEEIFNHNSLIYVDMYNNCSEYPKHTSTHCFWDMEPFDNTPYGIPFKKECNKFHIFGIFCSKECATAYLFNMHLENNVLWDRYSLLNYLYSENNETIKPALPRLCLKKFGGLKSIEKFRNNSNKSYNVIMPPMIGIVPLLEEIDLKKHNGVNNIQNNNELKLKRIKPLPNHKNTLESCMNLTYV